jgi:hypothetical protein
MPGDSAPATPQDPPDTPHTPNPQSTETDRRPSLAELYRRRDELGTEIDDHFTQLRRA